MSEKELCYDKYILSDLVPVSILDQDTGDTYPINDEGIFETLCNLLNKHYSEKYILEQRNNELENLLVQVTEENNILKQYHEDDLRHIHYLQLSLKSR